MPDAPLSTVLLKFFWGVLSTSIRSKCLYFATTLYFYTGFEILEGSEGCKLLFDKVYPELSTEVVKVVSEHFDGQWEIHTSYSLITNYTKNKNPLYKFLTNTLLQKEYTFKPTHLQRKRLSLNTFPNTLTYYKGSTHTNFSLHTSLHYTLELSTLHSLLELVFTSLVLLTSLLCFSSLDLPLKWPQGTYI